MKREFENYIVEYYPENYEVFKNAIYSKLKIHSKQTAKVKIVKLWRGHFDSTVENVIKYSGLILSLLENKNNIDKIYKRYNDFDYVTFYWYFGDSKLKVDLFDSEN